MVGGGGDVPQQLGSAAPDKHARARDRGVCGGASSAYKESLGFCKGRACHASKEETNGLEKVADNVELYPVEAGQAGAGHCCNGGLWLSNTITTHSGERHHSRFHCHTHTCTHRHGLTTHAVGLGSLLEAQFLALGKGGLKQRSGPSKHLSARLYCCMSRGTSLVVIVVTWCSSNGGSGGGGICLA